MCFGFSYVGFIWIVMLLVPNFIWTKNKPRDYDKYVVNENKVLLLLERTGEFIVTPVALMFKDFNFKGMNFWAVVLMLSFLCMILYEAFWIKYFKSEKNMEDFYGSICGIPVAGATLPVIAFILLGIYGGNILMLAGALILGTGHIGIHLQHQKEVCEPKKPKKLPSRIVKYILRVIAGIAIVIIIGAFTVCIASRNIKQIKRAFAYKDGVNEQIYITLNDQEEYISISGKDISNPVIIFLHGGPGSPTTFSDYCWQDYLTDEYTVVGWDERGCGRSYYRNTDIDPDNVSLSFDRQLEDLDALTDYLCDRFGQEKVIIIGHSYGSVLGSRYVLAHPEKVSAYIGVGQVAKTYEAFLNDNSIEELNELIENVPTSDALTTDVSTTATLTSPVLGVDDVRWLMFEMGAMSGDERYLQLVENPFSDFMKTFDVLETGDAYQMPVMFVSGTCDTVIPAELVKEYVGLVTAPSANLHLMEDCGHSPQMQLPEEFATVIKDFLKEI